MFKKSHDGYFLATDEDNFVDAPYGRVRYDAPYRSPYYYRALSKDPGDLTDYLDAPLKKRARYDGPPPKPLFDQSKAIWPPSKERPVPPDYYRRFISHHFQGRAGDRFHEELDRADQRRRDWRPPVPPAPKAPYRVRNLDHEVEPDLTHTESMHFFPTVKLGASEPRVHVPSTPSAVVEAAASTYSPTDPRVSLPPRPVVDNVLGGYRVRDHVSPSKSGSPSPYVKLLKKDDDPLDDLL
jgi:hypothetical protein